jgi:hypothetical protein
MKFVSTHPPKPLRFAPRWREPRLPGFANEGEPVMASTSREFAASCIDFQCGPTYLNCEKPRFGDGNEYTHSLGGVFQRPLSVKYWVAARVSRVYNSLPTPN